MLVGLGLVALKLFKGAQAAKLLLFGAFIWSLALNHPLPFAIALAYAVLVHESGHLLAMKQCGLKTSGMWFIPFLGAAAVARQGFRSYSEEFYIAIAGPLFGLLSLVPLFLGGFLLPRPYGAHFFGYAATAAFVNLFNLLPIGVLDGGRIVKSLSASLSRVLGFTVIGGGLLLCAILAGYVGGAVLGVILGISIAELWRSRRRQPLSPMSRGSVYLGTAAYVGLFAILVVLAFLALDLVAWPRPDLIPVTVTGERRSPVGPSATSSTAAWSPRCRSNGSHMRMAGCRRRCRAHYRNPSPDTRRRPWQAAAMPRPQSTRARRPPALSDSETADFSFCSPCSTSIAFSILKRLQSIRGSNRRPFIQAIENDQVASIPG